MMHIIETNAAVTERVTPDHRIIANDVARAALDHVAQAVMTEHGAETRICVDDEVTNFRIFAACNGAALRDTVLALDTLGYLN